MHLFTVVTLSVLPFLVGAVPASLNPSSSGGPHSIPLTKRSNYFRSDGTVDTEVLNAGVHHTEAFVSPLLIYEMVGLVTSCPFRRFKRALTASERNKAKFHHRKSKREHVNERRFGTEALLANHSNVQWIGEISVGIPPKAFRG